MTRIYLAIPYSWNPEESFRIANEVAAELMEKGHIVFSPISHSHPICKHVSEDNKFSHEFWLKQDKAWLELCDWVLFIVIGENGMELLEDSEGCQDEYKDAEKLDKHINYYYYDTERVHGVSQSDL